MAKTKFILVLAYGAIVAYYGTSLGTLPIFIGFFVQLISGSLPAFINGILQLLAIVWLVWSGLKYPRGYKLAVFQCVCVSIIFLANALTPIFFVKKFPILTSVFYSVTVLLFMLVWLKYTIEIIRHQDY